MRKKGESQPASRGLTARIPLRWHMAHTHVPLPLWAMLTHFYELDRSPHMGNRFPRTQSVVGLGEPISVANTHGGVPLSTIQYNGPSQRITTSPFSGPRFPNSVSATHRDDRLQEATPLLNCDDPCRGAHSQDLILRSVAKTRVQ